MIDPRIDLNSWNEITLPWRKEILCSLFEQELADGTQPHPQDFAKWLPPEHRIDLLRELLRIRLARISESLPAAVAVSCELSLEPTNAHITTNRAFDTRPSLQCIQEIALPAILKHYILLERIGIGTAGAVYRAEDTKLDRLVAIKLPHIGAIHDPKERYSFEREARMVAGLVHPGIVPVYAVESEGQSAFLVSELADGINLKDYLANHDRLSFHAAAILVEKVSIALEYAHQQGIIHRDIKPSNTMVRVANQFEKNAAPILEPRILDFGIARLSDRGTNLTREGVRLGTPAYMSPEQASGRSHLTTAASDVYSLGAMLYELLSGSTPFSGEASAVVEQVETTEPPSVRIRNPEVPDGLALICSKCLQLRPGDRYASANELALDLRRWLDDHPVIAKLPSVSKRIARLVGEDRWISTGLICLLLLAVSLGAFAIRHQKYESQLHKLARQLDLDLANIAASNQATTQPAWEILAANENDVEKMVQQLEICPAEELRAWIQALSRHPEAGLQAVCDAQASLTDISEDEKGEEAARISGNLMLAKLALNASREVWPMLCRTIDCRPRMYFIHHFQHAGIPPALLLERLQQKQCPTIQWALVLALGHLPPESWPNDLLHEAKNWMLSSYANHPDSGVHSACQWVLQRWGLQEQLSNIDRDLIAQSIVEERNWFVNPLGIHMVIVRGPTEFWMGRRADTKFPHDTGHDHLIQRSYAISSTEITVEQFIRLFGDANQAIQRFNPREPVREIGLKDMLTFCAKLGTDQGFLSQSETIQFNDKQVRVDLTSPGYRLPTAAETEWAARVGTRTVCFAGSRISPFVSSYALLDASQPSAVGTRIPNDLGLYDGYGNVSEVVATKLDMATLSKTELDRLELNVDERIICKGCNFQTGIRRGNEGSSTIANTSSPNAQFGFRIACTWRDSMEVDGTQKNNSIVQSSD